VKILLQGSYNKILHKWWNEAKENMQNCDIRNIKFITFCYAKSCDTEEIQ